MNKQFLAGLAVVVLVALQSVSASAGIQTFNIDQTFSQGAGADLSPTTIMLGGAGSFVLDPGYSEAYFDFTSPGGGTFSTIGTELGGYYFLDSYAAGELIGPGNFGTQVSAGEDWDTILVNGLTAGVWGNSHSGYLGFKTSTDLYGWIEYSFTRNAPISTIALLGGAYNDVANAGITTPSGAAVVPVPGALLLGGLGLSTISLFRRHGRRVPA